MKKRAFIEVASNYLIFNKGNYLRNLSELFFFLGQRMIRMVAHLRLYKKSKPYNQLNPLTKK